MQKNPHLLIEGCIIGVDRGRREQGLHLHPRRVRAAGRHPRRGGGRGVREGLPRRAASSAPTTRSSLVVHRGKGAYICGEETGLLDALEGKRGNPRLKPPFPANQGLYQGPTLINNVETLCNAPLIIEHGADWFKQFGEGNSTGTKLVSVSGNVQRPGNYEVELGVTGARHHLRARPAARPRGATLKCLFPGGSSAPVLTKEHLDLPYTFEAMAEAGSMLGTGLDHRGGRLAAARAARAAAGRVLPPRVVRQVRALPRGHELDREDARADRPGRGHADGPRHHRARSRTTSSATACACSATRWRCRSRRC